MTAQLVLDRQERGWGGGTNDEKAAHELARLGKIVVFDGGSNESTLFLALIMMRSVSESLSVCMGTLHSPWD